MKKVISLVLAIVLCLSCNLAIAEETYIYSEWAEKECERAIDAGWTDEFPNDFTLNITREQFCVVAQKMLSSCYLWEESDGLVKNPFTDTDNKIILYMHASGIIKGKGENIFAPDDLVTREEAAVILWRICENLTDRGELQLPEIMIDMAYADDEEISDWAKNAVYAMATHNIMQGTDKGFEPEGTFTCEQAIITFVRLYDIVNVIDEVVLFADKMNSLMPKDENYMFSPLSIKMAFALAANGAEGETKKEILDVLDIEDLDEFNIFAKGIIKKYSVIDMLKLDIANSVWINNSKTDDDFDEDFKNTAEEFYNAETGTVTNANAVDTVNGWVKEKTNGKIDSIIDNPDFWAMIVNAIYFKGAWESEFYKGANCEDLFTNGDGTQTKTTFMRNCDHYGYWEKDGVKIIELPFETDVVKFDDEGWLKSRESYPNLDTSMYILVSDRAINAEDTINNALKDKGFLPNTYIDFYMPKFKIEYSASIKDMLMSLGMEKAFDEKALGFSKVLEHEPLFVTDALHKTYISVDEKGSEAAAVTAIGMVGAGLPPEPIEFKVDKPFYFAIRDNVSGEILFMGRYAYAE